MSELGIHNTPYTDKVKVGAMSSSLVALVIHLQTKTTTISHTELLILAFNRYRSFMPASFSFFFVHMCSNCFWIEKYKIYSYDGNNFESENDGCVN